MERRLRFLAVTAASLILSVGAVGIVAAEGLSTADSPAPAAGYGPRDSGPSRAMHLFCSSHDERSMVGCQWSPVDDPRLAAYRVERDGTVVASIENTRRTAYIDHGVSTGNHTYRVAAIDGDGEILAASPVVEVFVGPSEIERLRLYCQPFDRGPYSVVACGWEESGHSDFAGYVVLRNGESIAFQAARDDNAWADFEPEVGSNTYEVLVVDDARAVIGRTNRVEVRSSGAGRGDGFDWFG